MMHCRHMGSVPAAQFLWQRHTAALAYRPHRPSAVLSVSLTTRREARLQPTQKLSWSQVTFFYILSLRVMDRETVCCVVNTCQCSWSLRLCREIKKVTAVMSITALELQG